MMTEANMAETTRVRETKRERKRNKSRITRTWFEKVEQKEDKEYNRKVSFFTKLTHSPPPVPPRQHLLLYLTRTEDEM